MNLCLTNIFQFRRNTVGQREHTVYRRQPPDVRTSGKPAHGNEVSLITIQKMNFLQTNDHKATISLPTFHSMVYNNASVSKINQTVTRMEASGLMENIVSIKKVSFKKGLHKGVQLISWYIRLLLIL